MKARLCGELKRIADAAGSAKLTEEAPDWASIDQAWSVIIEALQSPEFATDEKDKMDELDRILKWEFLGVEEQDFDWAAVAWDDILEAASSTTERLCNGTKKRA